MSRRPANPLFLPVCAILALCTLLLPGAPSAAADERVPMIASDELPTVGTVAPIARENVTHVRVGKRGEITWFAVTGVEGVVDYRGLVSVLRQRAGTARPSPHGVWLTASANHAWAHVLVLVKACFEAGIYRVGVRVRSEADGRVYGFPLFLPAAPTGRPGPRAGQLNLRVDALHRREAQHPSDLGHVYAAARRAVERRGEFGVDRIVAKIWLSPNTPLQYALSAIDLLYRGGCAGVRVQLSMKASWRGLDVVPVIEIQGGVVSRNPQVLKAPRVEPRRTAWGVDGANEPGWVDFQVTDLPAIDAAEAEPAVERPPPRPNYAAQATGVPPEVARAADETIRRWGSGLGRDMLDMLRQPRGIGPGVQKRFSVALRRKQVLPELVLPARQAFPDATRVIPSALQLSAFLFHQGRIQGRADITIATAGDAVRVIFGSWRPLDPSASITLVPFGVDPFVAGEAASFRIWVEDALHRLRRGGVAALPLAGSREVLPYLPAVAQAGTQRALAARGPALEALARAVAGTPYDRVALVPQTGTATVVGADNRVVGALTLRFEAQESELRINGLTARRAP